MLVYHATRDLVPLYAVYALLFREHGLSGGEISSLFVLWSVTAFVCEVPSGAWADSIDRRALLVASAAVYAAAFSSWMLWPGYPGYALGFVLWGLSGAMMSGTFEALLYDELVALGAADRYAAVTGWAHSTAMAANLAGTVLAAPLFALGGYPLVGWASVAAAVVHGGLALLLPRTPRTASVEALPAGAGGFWRRYRSMLGAGLQEASRQPVVRRAVLVSAAMLGLSAFDEYLPLVVGEHGVATAAVPLVVAGFVAGQVAGTALAGRTAGWSPARIAMLYGVGGVLVAAGAVAGRPLGFLGVAVGYGMVNNAFLVGQARLQQVVSGPARATVTSVSGLSSEVFALAVFAGVAVGSVWWSITAVVAALAGPMLGVAVLTSSWLPDPEPGQDPCEGPGHEPAR